MAVGGGGLTVVVMVEHLVTVVVMELHLVQEAMELRPVQEAMELLLVMELHPIPSHLCHRGPLQVLQGQ